MACAMTLSRGKRSAAWPDETVRSSARGDVTAGGMAAFCPENRGSCQLNTVRVHRAESRNFFPIPPPIIRSMFPFATQPGWRGIASTYSEALAQDAVRSQRVVPWQITKGASAAGLAHRADRDRTPRHHRPTPSKTCRPGPPLRIDHRMGAPHLASYVSNRQHLLSMDSRGRALHYTPLAWTQDPNCLTSTEKGPFNCIVDGKRAAPAGV